jgi:hypothetical protein
MRAYRVTITPESRGMSNVWVVRIVSDRGIVHTFYRRTEFLAKATADRYVVCQHGILA